MKPPACFCKAGMQPINHKVDYISFPWDEVKQRYGDGVAMRFDGNPVRIGVQYAPWTFRNAENLVETGDWIRMLNGADIPANSEDAW